MASDQYLPKAVHPGMRRLNNPSAGLKSRTSFLFRPFCHRLLMCGIKPRSTAISRIASPPCIPIKTEVLRMPAYIRPPDNNSIRQIFKPGRVMPVGSGRRQRQGCSFPVS
jgi:hypothetical protein